jgi:ParB family chromosome partitioning protein
MINKSLQKIPLSQVDIEDNTFRLSTQKADASLTDSIREIGLINPPLLQLRNDKQFRIILGFRRVEALAEVGRNEIEAFVVQKKPSDLKLFRFVLQAHVSERSCHPMAISVAIHKLRTRFKVERSKIIEIFLPLMGLSRNPKIFELFSPLCSLEPEIQQAVEKDKLSVEIAALIAKAAKKDRLAFFKLSQNLRLGKNRQREFWRIIADVARIENKNVNEILQDTELTKIMSEEKLTPNQKTDNVKREIWCRRYPRYSAIESEFQQTLKEMKLPPHTTLQPPPFFEGEDFKMNFTFKNYADFSDRLRLLQRLKDEGHIEKIRSLIP